MRAELNKPVYFNICNICFNIVHLGVMEKQNGNGHSVHFETLKWEVNSNGKSESGIKWKKFQKTLNTAILFLKQWYRCWVGDTGCSKNLAKSTIFVLLQYLLIKSTINVIVIENVIAFQMSAYYIFLPKIAFLKSGNVRGKVHIYYAMMNMLLFLQIPEECVL